MTIKIHYKERLYFAIMSIISLPVYALVIYKIVFDPSYLLVVYGIYALMLIAFFALMKAYFIGYLRGNAIKVSKQQFPEVFEILKTESQKLGIQHTPTLWLLQGGGILNAMATRFNGKNHVVLYSDIFEEAYKQGLPAVKFILGHELGHIRGNHLGFLKSVLIAPAKLVPFLNWAYSRGCEYTSDTIGYNLAHEGAEMGILILAAGKELHKKVNVEDMLSTAQNERGFAFWLAEICSTHPHLVKRIEHLHTLQNEDERTGAARVDTSKITKETGSPLPKNDSDQPLA